MLLRHAGPAEAHYALSIGALQLPVDCSACNGTQKQWAATAVIDSSMTLAETFHPQSMSADVYLQAQVQAYSIQCVCTFSVEIGGTRSTCTPTMYSSVSCS